MNIQNRLEELRTELRKEKISYKELAELQSLRQYIDASDIELREAAGVPEFPTTITEREIGLIGRRLNAKKDLKEVQAVYTQAEEEGVQVTDEQAQKGFNWLYNLYKTPRGIERKNNPYGIREMNMLDTGLGHFTYDGHFNGGNAYVDWYTPMYTFYDKEGFSFQYYVSGGEIKIIG